MWVEKMKTLPPCFNNHVTKLDKKEVTDYYHCLATKKVREVMVDVLKDMVEINQTNSEKSSKYDCPNWSFNQADSVGYRRALREVINILEKS